MDILSTTEPKSDQQNYDDYSTAPRTVTVSEVKKGSAEQPVEVHLVEFPGRPFKPSKSMRRVLIAAWGPEAAAYAGRRMTLYGDPTVRFGGQEVGGIRISHLSHLPEALSVHLTVSRGKRAPFVVEPLREDTADGLAKDLKAAPTLEELTKVWARVASSGFARDQRLITVSKSRSVELGGKS